MSDPEREHLFISYATEDGAFAEWLALRLTGEGYKVWCDRITLLGGESYPRDIDVAIKQRTFRFLAVLSPSSIQKPNPLKERTLALNLAAQRNEPFVIPLNLTGVPAAELDWMTSDITFVPFHHGWAEGLAKLLKALDKSNAPKTLQNGRSLVAHYVEAQSSRSPQPERLWSNVLEITKLPPSLVRVAASPKVLDQTLSGWPHHRENATVAWAFELPGTIQGVRTQQLDWNAKAPGSGFPLRNAVANLLRQYLERYCVQRGLQLSDDGTRFKQLHFNSDTVTGGWLSFVGYDGVRSRVKALGERRFWVGQDARETTRYHLAPIFAPALEPFATPSVVVRVRLHLTDAEGNVLPVRKAIGRRKAICKNWWNYEWLARMFAVSQWLTRGLELNLALTATCQLRLAPSTRSLEVPEGVQEGEPAPLISPDEPDIIDEEEQEDGVE